MTLTPFKLYVYLTVAYSLIGVASGYFLGRDTLDADLSLKFAAVTLTGLSSASVAYWLCRKMLRTPELCQMRLAPRGRFVCVSESAPAPYSQISLRRNMPGLLMVATLLLIAFGYLLLLVTSGYIENGYRSIKPMLTQRYMAETLVLGFFIPITGALICVKSRRSRLRTVCLSLITMTSAVTLFAGLKLFAALPILLMFLMRCLTIASKTNSDHRLQWLRFRSRSFVIRGGQLSGLIFLALFFSRPDLSLTEYIDRAYSRFFLEGVKTFSLVEQYVEERGYQFGQTLVIDLASKLPSVERNFQGELASLRRGESARFAVTPTFAGEAYANFGHWGVGFVSALLGLVFAWLESRRYKRIQSAIATPFLLYFLAIRCVTVGIGGVLFAILFVTLLNIVLSARIKSLDPSGVPANA